MKREIIIDTETTGLDRKVDRFVEIGCVEIIDLKVTGTTYHKYINPTHPVHREAFKVHGLSNEFLKTKPTFRRTVNSFLTFIEGATLVAHNASFDIGMLNAELDRLNLPPLENEVVDSLALAREQRPGSRHTLDSLCRAFKIDISKRTKHGALLDAELLTEVYIELRGGRQFGMTLDLFAEQKDETLVPARQRPVPLPSRVTDEDRAAHKAFVETMGDKSIWLDYCAN
ncbi:DNA polymerase III subunit epsilon [Bradyrhizobium erythrophlei]|uniref:DNA polymerase III subunit epsilon n=1 Tax=Bradyrhizobium erythrophlei TaxID=1437360 RepID=A0A1M5PP65_9BRAD|nr:DNA polymerase III subunit epsilon [Bradyrhizobium erythrophlei]SHH03567.1 DNA polymerase-3 subunit epsilon [Bradyrhizobium erythrophlei]